MEQTTTFDGMVVDDEGAVRQAAALLGRIGGRRSRRVLTAEDKEKLAEARREAASRRATSTVCQEVGA